jgi:Tfp pilus assembly protein PilV
VVSASGISLVEVLISTTLLAGALVSLPHVFAMTARAALEAGHVTVATLLAAQKVEEIRSGPLPPSSASGVELLDAHGADVEASGSTPVYTRTWWTEPLESTPSSAPAVTIAIGVSVSRYVRTEVNGRDPAGGESARIITLRTGTGS